MSDSTQDRKPTRKLPPSGLAEDVLGERGSSEAEPPAPPRPRPEGPDRLYDFADSLSDRNGTAPDREVEEQLETWVTFALAGESFGLPVTHVQEILRVAGITRVPHAPHPVRGVTNMRGKVLPVVDLRVRLGLSEKEIDDHARILVVSSKGRYLGLLVDGVQQVVRLARSRIQPPPPEVMTSQSDYILGVYQLDDSIVILLEVDRVLLIRDSVSDR
jgi:purine-binding chemotaxis protein CheW